MLFPVFVLSAIGSIIIFSVVAILLKYIIPEAGGSFQFMILNMFFLFVGYITIHIFYSLVTGNIPSLTFYQVFLIFLAGIFGFIGYATYILGLERGNASVGGVVLSSRVFMAVPLAYFVVGEVYSNIVYLYILIAFAGAIMVSWQENLHFIEILKFHAAGMRYFILTALFWSIQNLIIRIINNSIELITFLSIRVTFFLIFAALWYFVMTKQQKIKPVTISRSLIQKILFYVCLSIAGQFGLVYALGENLSITETIGVFEGTLTFLFAFLFAKFVSNEVLTEHIEGKILYIRIVGVVLSLIGTLATIASI